MWFLQIPIISGPLLLFILFPLPYAKCIYLISYHYDNYWLWWLRGNVPENRRGASTCWLKLLVFICWSLKVQSDLDNPPPSVPGQFWADYEGADYMVRRGVVWVMNMGGGGLWLFTNYHSISPGLTVLKSGQFWKRENNHRPQGKKNAKQKKVLLNFHT